MQGHLSTWLVKHELVHRYLGFDDQGIEALQIKFKDWYSVTVISYVYGYSYLRSQCGYDVAPGGLLTSVYHLTRIQYSVKYKKSYDMLGIYYDNNPHLKRILMPESWIGWPIHRDYIAPNFYKIRDLN
ncbi:hypothetical protein AMTRI_Chr05g70680 [Amborella trichopoda]